MTHAKRKKILVAAAEYLCNLSFDKDIHFPCCLAMRYGTTRPDCNELTKIMVSCYWDGEARGEYMSQYIWARLPFLYGKDLIDAQNARIFGLLLLAEMSDKELP